MSSKLPTLRIRLALFYAGFLAAALLAFGAAVYTTFAMAEAEEDEPQEQKDVELRSVRHQIFVALVAGIPLASSLAALGGSYMTRRTVRALGDIVSAAGRVGPEQLGARITCDPDAEDEVQKLVAALNDMLRRIETAVHGMRNFTADAAHELRTPLAAVMGEIERCLHRPRDPETLRQTMEGALEGLGQLARLLDALLTLARSDAGQVPVQLSTVDAGALLAQVTSPYEGLESERQLRLVVHADERVALRTDPVLLSRALANLVDNACKFVQPGGTIEVSCRRMPAGGVELAVADTGPGLSDEDQARGFERFYRSLRYRGHVEGFGLGLPLTREFVHALGGEVTLKNRTGGGTLAVITLPEPAAARP